ncbi:MAG TPA: ABC transporter ATP-binding protein [Longimicrobiales bacterium]|nr:ABC transporter ATP-binding protein [Longimicrobiales bacterium]
MSQPGVYRRVLGYLTPYRALALAAVLATAGFAIFDAFTVVALLPLLNALFAKAPLDLDIGNDLIQRLLNATLGRVQAGDPQEQLLLINAFLLAIFFLKTVFDFLQNYFVVRLEQAVTRDLRNQAYQHVLALDMRFFNRTRAGQIISRLTSDADQLRLLLTKNLIKFATYVLQVVVTLWLMLQISVGLTLIGVIALPLMVASWSRFRKRIRRGDRNMLNLTGEVASHLQETVMGIRQVKAAAAETFEVDRFRGLTWRLMKATVRNERLRALAGPLTELIGAFGTVLLLWYGARQVLDGVLGPSVFLGFLLWAVKLYAPAKWLSRFQSIVQPGLVAAERIFEFMDAPIEIVDRPNARRFEAVRAAIRFEDVSFAYENDVRVLDRVSFEVPVGTVVALVGPSGAGKTTIADLLARFYDPTAGRITIDGVDLREFSTRSLRERMGVVAQDTVLFHDTVRANIAYGLRDVSAAAIEQAARVANAHEFIEELPAGYDTVLGERGTRLSGGQRQRLAIARAILRDPAILILDEATSALDSESERLVQQATDELLRGRTVFVIAHRLSTIRHADQILVLREGRIVEQGRHDELLSRDGAYRRLYDLQFAGR